MPFVLNATPGDPAANSYLTVAEFQDYLLTAYEPSEASNVLDDGPLLALATRTLNAQYAPHKTLMRTPPPPYYIINATWTGTPTTTTQALPWPRTGMYDLNGNTIDSMTIPQALKDAVAELARQMKAGDRTIDSDIAVQGITSVKAGSVSVSFKDSGIATLKVIPEAVELLLVPSWLTDERIEPAWPALFDVVSD